MIIHLIRHAQAVERQPDIQEDHRYLTCRGRKRFRKVAAALNKLGINPETIITSPKIRAVQTAEILAETLRFAGEMPVVPALGNDFSVSSFQDLLAAHSSAKELVLVGHEPDFGMLVGELLQLEGDCALSKGCTVTLAVTVTKSGIAAQLQSLVTGGGTVIRAINEAVERLQGKND